MLTGKQFESLPESDLFRKGGSGIVIRENGHATLSGNTITGYRKPVSDPEKTAVIEK